MRDGINSVFSRAQTFTAGLTGGLDQVDLQLSHFGVTADLTVEIQTVSGGLPSGTVLASTSVPAASVTPMFEGAWVSVPIGPTSVTSGTQYAIVLSTTDPELYLVGGATTDAYTGGQPLINSGAGWSTSGSFVEFAFKTYVLNALAVTFRSASALRTGKGVVVRWRTASEVETLGFNVYRQISGKRVKLNRHLIPARSSLSGAAYSYRDRRARRARSLRYWLQVVDLDGSRTWRGPIRVTSARAL